MSIRTGTNAAADYDAALLDKARELIALKDIPQMRRWMIELGGFAFDNVAKMDTALVEAYILGRLQATTAELVRWIEREHHG